MTETPSKKYIVTGFVGLLVVAIAAFFMMSKNKLPTTIVSPRIEASLFELAPKQFDQFVYIHSDDRLKEILASASGSRIPATFQKLVANLDEALIWKYSTGNASYDLLFLQGDSVDISALQKQGIVSSATGYTTKQINENTWVFGSTDVLGRYKDTEKNLTSIDALDGYLAGLQQGTYNMGFISKPNTLSGTPLFDAILQKMQYTIVMTDLGAKATKGQVILQFVDGVVHAPKKMFTPMFDKYQQDNTVLSLEINDILGFAGIEKEQFLTVFPAFLQQGGSVYTALRGEKEYKQIYDTLQKQIGVLFSFSETSPIGGEISLLFENKEIFDTAKILSPLWKNTLVGLLGTGANIHETINDNELTYSANNSLIGSGEQTLFRLVKKDDMTVVSLFDDGKMMDGSSPKKDIRAYTDTTVMSFSFDGAKMQSLGKQLGNIGGGVNTWGQGIFLGSLEMKEKEGQVVVNFETK